MELLEIAGIIALIVGFIMIGIEIIVPGFGLPGVSGIICLVVGILLLADSVAEGVYITIVVLALIGILLAVILWLLSRGKLKSPIILDDEQKKADGYLSSNDLQYLLGKTGVAQTDLRPTGTGKIDDINFDLLSEGGYIEKGSRIKIIKVEGSKLIVREI